MIHIFETGYLQDEEMEDEIMADFFETLENDMRKGADEIRKGWDAFKGSLKMAAFDLGQNEKEHLEAENAIYTWTDGDVEDFPYFFAGASTKDQAMRTLATMMMRDDRLVSPCNGVVASIDENNNTIAIVVNDEVIVAVKVCTGSVDFSKEATILVKQGEFIHLGQPLVQFNQKMHAKTKLLLVKPACTIDLKAMGFKPAASKGTQQAGTKLISK